MLKTKRRDSVAKMVRDNKYSYIEMYTLNYDFEAVEISNGSALVEEIANMGRCSLNEENQIITVHIHSNLWYKIHLIEDRQNKLNQPKKEDKVKPYSKETLKTVDNIVNTIIEMEWELNKIEIKEDNCIHGLVTKKNGLKVWEGLYAPSYQLTEVQEVFNCLNSRIVITEIIDDIEEIKEVSTLVETEEIENNNNSEPVTAQQDNSITVRVNEEKQGIEIIFNEKPSQEVLEQLKSNGFRWSKFQKLWYTKDNDRTRSFINSLTAVEPEIKDEKIIDYPEVNIEDIESYTVSKELSKRENDNSMFRRNDTDHIKEIQNTMQNFNNMVLEALQGNSNVYIEYKAKEGLQRFKKKYYDIYVRMLTHRANNPSWAVTGRGNLNVSRYNKKVSQYEKMMGESVQIYNDFEKHVNKIKNMVRTELKQKLDKEVKQNIDSVKELPKFEKVKIKYNPSNVSNIFDNGTVEKTVNKLDNYYILNNWGCWRVYNLEGNEIYSTKTTGILKEAQQWLIFHLSKLDITEKAI